MTIGRIRAGGVKDNGRRGHNEEEEKASPQRHTNSSCSQSYHISYTLQ
jgi:hypothetical protein